MNNLLNNAKAGFFSNFLRRRGKFCKIQVQWTENKILFSDGKSLSEIQFDSDFVHNSEFIDCRYFSQLFQSVLPRSKNYSVLLTLPSAWILQYRYPASRLVDHQLEREVIYYFQHTFHININEYEFFMEEELQKSMAVKKTLIESLTRCFDKGQIKFKIPTSSASVPIEDNYI